MTTTNPAVEAVTEAIRSELWASCDYHDGSAVEGIEDAALAAIVAARPYLRAELFDELIAEMEDRQGSREFSKESQADCLYLADVLRSWREADHA